jgi:hypothetical protein
MKNKTIILVISLLLCIIGILIAINYKYELKDANNYDANYNLKSKEFKGLYIFDQLLEKCFGEKNISKINYIKDFSKIDSNTLYINIGDRVKIGTDKSDLFYNFLNDGGKALIICERSNIILKGFDNDVYQEDFEKYDYNTADTDSTASLDKGDDSDYKNNDENFNVQDSSNIEELDTINNNEEPKSEFHLSKKQKSVDSITSISYETNKKVDSVFFYNNEKFTFKK